MAEHTLQGLMNVTMDKVRQMADANTIIGKAIKTEDGTTIIPVSRISVGIGTGGSDFDSKNSAQKDLFGGGSGLEMSHMDKRGVPTASMTASSMPPQKSLLPASTYVFSG